LSELTRQMADTAAGVAGLLVETTTVAAGVAAAVAAAAIRGTALGAVAGNVADLTALELTVSTGRLDADCECTYLVALSAGLAAAAAGGLTARGRAVAGDMAGLAAAVAGLGVLRTLGAVTAYYTVSP